MSVAELKIPKQLGEFRLGEKIGQGGICEVYRAHQASLDRPVAVKILRPRHLADHELSRRFVREAKILAQLSHPNIIHVIDAGTDQERAWYAMEFVEGIDFKQLLRQNKLSLPEKIGIIVQMLHGLQYAHENGVIHRDLKPANIMVDTGGNARLTDFGIAHLLAEADKPDSTKTGERMGTPAYMAPEQRTSAKNVDIRSDIFSVGVILYEIVTARKPVGRVRRPSELNPIASASLDEVIFRCLEHDPALRPQSARELAQVLTEKNVCRTAQAIETGTESTLAKVDGFIGRCKFLDTLRESSTTSTYVVENTTDRQMYVIKKISGRAIELGSLRRLAALSHPHILKIHGAGSDVKKVVLVTDYARSGSLADRLNRTWTEDEVRQLLAQAAHALDFAHKNGILHGNLRPENVLFDTNDAIRLADFGLPPQLGKRKPWWRAPENRQSRQADLFSLGAIGYRLLYGDRPRWFSADELHFPKTQPPVSGELRDLLSALLQQDPDKRMPTAEQIVRCLDKSASAQRAEEIRPIHRNILPLWAWGLIAAGFLTATAALLWWR